MKPRMSKEDVMKVIKECAAKMGRVPSFAQVSKASKLTIANIRTSYGTYKRALEACGLERQGSGYETTPLAVFEDWAGVVRRLGKIPTQMAYQQESAHSVRPLLRRFQRWTRVPAGLLEFCRKERLQEKYADVQKMLAEHVERKQEACRKLARREGKVMPGELTYGEPLTISPMTYAPTCEDGVIFLFGHLAPRLGFAVERIQGAFPDCTALREVRPGVWQRVKIEFEQESRNFLLHGHPVDGCQIIVCWIHNWENCPLEVIELKKVMDELRGRVGW